MKITDRLTCTHIKKLRRLEDHFGSYTEAWSGEVVLVMAFM